MSSMDSEIEEDSAAEACVSPEGPLLPSNSREMRNRAEKMRRDKLNSYIGELATLVPMVARSSKRMDKTSILRLTATHLRIYQTLLNGKCKTKINIPKNVDQFVLEQLVYEQLGGFLLILTTTGKIVFVSHTVEALLGHLQTDLMGQSIFNLIANEDHIRFRMYLSPDGLSEKEWRKYFNLRLRRAGPRSESAVYETVNVVGMQRPLHASTSTNESSNCRDIATVGSLNNDVWVFFVRIFKQDPLQNQLIEASKDEYVTRHLVDGRIINCDQRISFVAGYMIEEVTGLSAFKFMHREDVRWVMIALRQMYDKGQSQGTSCYRLLSRTGQFIYLKTCGYLEVDSTGTVESFICINSLVNEKEGEELIKEMKERYAALLQTNTPSITDGSGESSSASVEDPAQLEAAIAHLVTNLPSPESEHPSTPSPGSSSICENQDCPPATDDPYSPQTSMYINVKTAPKRPLGTELKNGSKKRHREPDDEDTYLMNSFERPMITEISVKTENR